MATEQPANQTKTPKYTPTQHIFNPVQSQVTFLMLLYIVKEIEPCYLCITSSLYFSFKVAMGQSVDLGGKGMDEGPLNIIFMLLYNHSAGIKSCL